MDPEDHPMMATEVAVTQGHITVLHLIEDHHHEVLLVMDIEAHLPTETLHTVDLLDHEEAGQEALVDTDDTDNDDKTQ